MWKGEFILYFPLWHVNGFTTGILFAQLFKRLATTNIPRLLPPIVGLASAIAIGMITGYDNPIRPHIHNGLLAPIIGIMLLSFSLDRTILSSIMGWRPFVYLGNLTYAICIFQCPVYIWYGRWALNNETTDGGFILYAVILLGISTLVYHFIEVPSRKKMIGFLLDRIK